MNFREGGFTYIECIISLSLVVLATYMLYTSLSNCYKLVLENEVNRDMLNIAKIEIESKKSEIKNSSNEQKFDGYSVKNYSNYKVEYKVDKVEDYYRCYKVFVKVNDFKKNVELVGYVTK